MCHVRRMTRILKFAVIIEDDHTIVCTVLSLCIRIWPGLGHQLDVALFLLTTSGDLLYSIVQALSSGCNRAPWSDSAVNKAK